MDFNRLCPHCLTETDIEKDKCECCGKNPKETPEITHHLKPFTILQGKYLVGSILGEGGFGITYIGLDINLEVKVAIKEFFPNGYCTRDGKLTTQVTAYSGESMDIVNKWRDNFMKEARALAKCSNLPGVVGVRDFFSENNTAYIVLEYLEGMNLKEIMKASGGKITADQLLPAMEPVLDALAEVHKHGLIHRDISPDNIMRLKNGQMKLLDFGAARDFIRDGEKSLSVLLKPGYAPEEQYRTKGNQGPWSDVYALAGTMYKCLTGVTPPEALERLRVDELRTPASLGVKLKPNQEAAILKGLAVLAEERYQTVDEFKAALYGSPSAAKPLPVANSFTTPASEVTPVSAPISSSVSPAETQKENSLKRSLTNPQFLPLYIAIGVVAVICIVLGIALISALNKKTDYGSAPVASVSDSTDEDERAEYEVTVRDKSAQEETVDNSTASDEGMMQALQEAAAEPVYEEEIEEEEEEVYYPPIDVDIEKEYYEILNWVSEHDKYINNYQYVAGDGYGAYLQDGTIVKMVMDKGFGGTKCPSIHHGVDLYYIEVDTESGPYELFYSGSNLVRLIDPNGAIYDYGCEEWKDCVEFAFPYERAEAILRSFYN